MNVPVGKTVEFILIPSRSLGRNTGNHGNVFWDKMIVSQGHLQAHIGA